MVYPRFEKSSIIERCAQDIDKFLKEVTVDAPSPEVIKLNPDVATMDDMKTCIDVVVQRMLETSKKTNIVDFNYPHDIIEYDPQTQGQLWILRTYMFYQLLLFATAMMSDEKCFNDVYANETTKRTFRPEITPELPKFLMGIFGSLSPTSDIDIGIQYSGHTENLVGLSYIVSVLEDMFVIFLKMPSLQMDIEAYADMMTLPSANDKDIFYLDTKNFGAGEFLKMLPLAGASIVRNYAFAKLDEGNEDLDKVIDEFNFAMLSTYYKEFFLMDETTAILDDKGWQAEAKEMVKTYFNQSYNQQREQYYELVNAAESSLQGVKAIIKQGETPPPVADIVLIMANIGRALAHRAESYTCAPTVMHVVRVLQANKDSPDKYPTETPEFCKFPKENAVCSIGKIGYLLSMMEQMGYFIRFDITYCQNGEHFNKAKCDKKKQKYSERYDSANEFIKRMAPRRKSMTVKSDTSWRRDVGGGGKRRRRNKKTKKRSRRSRR